MAPLTVLPAVTMRRKPESHDVVVRLFFSFPLFYFENYVFFLFSRMDRLHLNGCPEGGGYLGENGHLSRGTPRTRDTARYLNGVKPLRAGKTLIEKVL